jgi:hypothetical protein
MLEDALVTEDIVSIAIIVHNIFCEIGHTQ